MTAPPALAAGRAVDGCTGGGGSGIPLVSYARGAGVVRGVVGLGVTPAAPGHVAATQVAGAGETELPQRCRRQARGVALRAHHDHGLVVPADLGQRVVPGQVEAPLEHVALHNEAESELALGGTLGGRPDVDHQRAGRRERVQLVGFDAPDLRPGRSQEIVGAVRRQRTAAASAPTGSTANAVFEFPAAVGGPRHVPHHQCILGQLVERHGGQSRTVDVQAEGVLV